jgi:hypothetical protein
MMTFYILLALSRSRFDDIETNMSIRIKCFNPCNLLKTNASKVTITMDIVTPTANRLYINDYLYIITMKITRERLFLFALIAATIIAVIVAPFVVGQM